MRKYRKLVAAVIGIAVLVAVQRFDVAVPGLSGIVSNLIVGALTAWGVYQVPNDA